MEMFNMAACERIQSCPFFNEFMLDMPATTEYLKTVYCRGDYARCARYMVAKALGAEKVPLTLFPDESDKAVRLIQGR
jgi:hypothetical protein